MGALRWMTALLLVATVAGLSCAGAGRDAAPRLPAAGRLAASSSPVATGARFEPTAIAVGPSRIVCTLHPGQTALPPRTVRGLADHLIQYPDVSLATTKQRAAATRLLAAAGDASAQWRDPRIAARAGYDVRVAKRTADSPVIGYLHAENRRNSNDRRFLDPRRPEVLIYANQIGRPLVLVGVMFSMPRGKLGPTPGGAIDRWHSHIVCVRGTHRGLAPLDDGTCPKGARLAQGSEMLHLWFTSDLRSAFAVHAPVPELCRDGLLTPAACRSAASRYGM